MAVATTAAALLSHRCCLHLLWSDAAEPLLRRPRPASRRRLPPGTWLQPSWSRLVKPPRPPCLHWPRAPPPFASASSLPSPRLVEGGATPASHTGRVPGLPSRPRPPAAMPRAAACPCLAPLWAAGHYYRLCSMPQPQLRPALTWLCSGPTARAGAVAGCVRPPPAR